MSSGIVTSGREVWGRSEHQGKLRGLGKRWRRKGGLGVWMWPDHAAERAIMISFDLGEVVGDEVDSGVWLLLLVRFECETWWFPDNGVRSDGRGLFMVP